MRRHATGVVWVLLLAMISCAGGEPLPPTLSAEALPGMESRVSVLTAESLAHDALDPAALGSLLADAGYVHGRERTYAGPGERFSLAITRVLVFGTSRGADAYLSWLREHPDELLGAVEPLEPLDLPGSPFLMVHVPGGCCPKSVPIYLSAWRRGSRVLFIQAAGRKADPRSVADLALELDRVAAGATDA